MYGPAAGAPVEQRRARGFDAGECDGRTLGPARALPARRPADTGAGGFPAGPAASAEFDPSPGSGRTCPMKLPDRTIPFSVPQPTVAIAGGTARFPVHRIYCVGRNYAAHAREMGGDPTREPPCFFMKPADAVVENDAAVPYASRTSNLHHEVELVVAIGVGGHEIPAARALDHVFGYAVGNDLTRRDLQAAAKQAGQPWDVSKGFDRSAPISAI